MRISGFCRFSFSTTPGRTRAAKTKRAVLVVARCKLSGQTGVEMEALTAASVAALTIYDMCKAVDRGMTIESVRVLEKLGGKSGHFQAHAS